MCGFTGIITNRYVSSEMLLKMGNQIEYRGPDYTGYEIVQIEKKNVGFVHKRLSIIDLSEAGNQPMWNNSHTVCMVFNGEIYNFKEIRDELKIKHGITFRSDSDSEVILVLYDLYGINFLKNLVGMFAIVLLDISLKKLYLIRDRVGVKPLYFGWNNGAFYFGSELKAFFGDKDFKPELNKDAIRSFLQYGYIPVHQSIYDKIHKVMLGSYVELDLKTEEIVER